VVQDFQIAANSTTETVKAGGTPTAHVISITGAGGFSGAVTLACSNLPSLATCSFTTNPVSAGGSSSLTIQTAAPSVSQLRPPAGSRTAPLYALWLTMPGIVVGIIGIGMTHRNRRGKLLGYIGLVVVLGISLMLASCGGGGSTTTPPVPKPGTPAGMYPITVTGTSGSGANALSHNTVITLTVQ
jgi:hypothetical protein